MLGRRRVDVGLQPGVGGDPADDVRVGHLLERPDVPPPMQAVRSVERLDDHPARPGTLVQLDRGDLADPDALAVIAAAELDLELRPDREARIVDEADRQIDEPDRHDGREIHVVLDHDLLDGSEDVVRGRRAAQLDLARVEKRRVDHVRPIPRGRRQRPAAGSGPRP